MRVDWKRTRPRRRAVAIAVVTAVLAIVAATFPLADVALTLKDADSFQRKIAIINRNSQSLSKTPRQTPVRESELNAYFRFQAQDDIPVGVVDPYVTIIGDGRLAGRATVDLDAVRKQRSSGGWLDPKSYLTGRLPVTARGILHTKSGVGRLQIESAEISGVTIPLSLLQELVSFYSRTPENPKGVNLDDPFDLPAQITEIRVGKGEAVVVQ